MEYLIQPNYISIKHQNGLRFKLSSSYINNFCSSKNNYDCANHVADFLLDSSESYVENGKREQTKIYKNRHDITSWRFSHNTEFAIFIISSSVTLPVSCNTRPLDCQFKMAIPFLLIYKEAGLPLIDKSLA